MTHERGPYSLVMALTATTTYAESTADGFREAARTSEPLLSKRDQPAVESAFNVLRRSLQSSVDKLQEIIGIAIESMDVEIARLGVKPQPDAATQVVSERLRDILGRTE